jgi:trypsin
VPVETGEYECKCGVPNRVQKIVGGVETEMHEYPWQVGITSPDSNRPFCGGSILSSKTILTASHCTKGSPAKDLVVVVAEHDWSQDDGQERHVVCGKTEHPQYNSRTQDKDFSILTLCSPLSFRREVQPICLPSLPGPSYDNVAATVSGWGTLASGGVQPNHLMEVNVTTMSNTECGAAYGTLTPSMICAKDSGRDACQGDSGGPLITKEGVDYYSQIGVVSWGFGCAHARYPGVYARVSQDIDFIKSNIGGTICPRPNY